MQNSELSYASSYACHVCHMAWACKQDMDACLKCNNLCCMEYDDEDTNSCLINGVCETCKSGKTCTQNSAVGDVVLCTLSKRDANRYGFNMYILLEDEMGICAVPRNVFEWHRTELIHTVVPYVCDDINHESRRQRSMTV